ncbi:mechanosensitive ion channel family protein [Methanocaldococcus indicus]|uniref:mechanosensitive ion channel family protein n=1 Tax=Methanocaldococcus indicus TaxID=213231 RepID=UPI003C6D064C
MEKEKLKLAVKIALLLVILSLMSKTLFNIHIFIISYLLKYKTQILTIVAIVLSGLIVVDVITDILKKQAEKDEKNAEKYISMSYISKYTIYLIIILSIFGVFYQNLSSLVVSIGLIGAAVTYALQRPILNVAGWLVMLYTRTIKIGDRIIVKNAGIGDVFDIDTQHIYLSELTENFEPTGRVLIVPNSLIFTNTIENLTKGTPYIWDNLVINFTFNSNIKKAENIVFSSANEVVGKLMKELYSIWSKRKYLTRRKLVDKPYTRVGITRTSFYIKVFYLTHINDRARVRSEIQRKVLEKVKKESDVELAYPHLKIVEDKKWSWN